MQGRWTGPLAFETKCAWILTGSVSQPALSPKEHIVVQHFEAEHTHNSSGCFVVPLHRCQTTFGESRAQAVRCFLSLECTLHAKGQFHGLKIGILMLSTPSLSQMMI